MYGGCKRRRELSWRQLEQRAGRHDSRASASAPTAAADGRLLLDGAPLLKLIDFFMRKIMRLHYWPRDEVEKVLLVPAKELAAQLGTVRGSCRPWRWPACPLARVLHSWHRRGYVRYTWACGGSQCRQEHP